MGGVGTFRYPRYPGGDGQNWITMVILLKTSKNPTHSAGYVCLGKKKESKVQRLNDLGTEGTLDKELIMTWAPDGRLTF